MHTIRTMPRATVPQLRLATAAMLMLVLGLPSRGAAAQAVTAQIVPEPEATRCPACTSQLE